MRALGLACVLILGCASVKPATARTIDIATADIKCIADNFTAYAGSRRYPLYVVPGTCPKLIDDLAKVRIAAKNSSTPGVPKGKIIALSRAELVCAVRQFRALPRNHLQARLKLDLTRCPA